MVTIRRGVDTSFKDLAEAINALYTLNELGEKNPQTRELLSTIIDGINAYIDQAELVYNRRTGGKK
jgi:acyl-homoserine lactone acylase PvdQ